MKLKIIIIIFFAAMCCRTQAQTLNNIFADSKALETAFGKDTAFGVAEIATWAPIVKNYIPTANQVSSDSIMAYIKRNPFYSVKFSKPNVDSITIMNYGNFMAHIISQEKNTNSVGSNVAYGLTDLIIERAKEELTATFFQNFKKQLGSDHALGVAFPKTLKFISQIQPYLYTSYLSSLREAFFADINDLPFNIGSILRTPELKTFIDQYPVVQNLWLTVPLLQFVGDLHNGKPIADAIIDLNPDQELLAINPEYYNILKITAIISQSIRDPSRSTDWISASDFTEAMKVPNREKAFYLLLFEEIKSVPRASNKLASYINPKNISAVQKLIADFIDAYQSSGALGEAYLAVKDSIDKGSPVNPVQAINLLNSTKTVLQATLKDIKALNLNASASNNSTDAYFNDFSQLLVIFGDFKQKNYASGIMNTMVLMNQYFGNPNTTPFNQIVTFAVIKPTDPNISTAARTALTYLTTYQKNYPKDKIDGLVNDLTKDIAGLSLSPNVAQVKALNKDFAKIQAHIIVVDTKAFNGNVSYQRIFKYATLMATMAEAKTPLDVQNALDAAILPVGSSSIKYFTAFSISLNSYIGGAYYHSNYNMVGADGKLAFNTLGVALPIGLNFSVSTRWKEVGAVSIFASVIDLGAVASYRLNNPSNTTVQTLPEFSFQNLLAPGGFLVFNRLFNTPLAIGIGAQRSPQLSNITNGSSELTVDPKWRFGAFLSVDIPLFNVYAKALKRPIK